MTGEVPPWPLIIFLLLTLMKLKLETYAFHHLLTLLEQCLQPDYLTNREGSTIKIFMEDHTTLCRAMDFTHGLGLCYFDIYLNEDLDMLFDIEQYHPLRFLYCLKGHIMHSGVSGQIQHVIEEGQYVSYACQRGSEQVIRLPAYQHIQCVALQIVREEYIQHRQTIHLPLPIRQIMDDKQAEKPYLLHDDYATHITDSLHRALENQRTGYVGDLLFEASALEILAHQFEVYLNDIPSLSLADH